MATRAPSASETAVRALPRCSPPNRPGVLSTLSGAFGPGFPYAFSAIPTGAVRRGPPLLLLSRLGGRTPKNLLADPRASLFIGDRNSAAEKQQAGTRISLLGRVTPLPAADEGRRTRYVGAWPRAADYLVLRDFSFWRLEI